MRRRKTDKPKKKRHNLTSHDRAMADIRVRADVDALKSNWPNLSGPEQGQRLQKLIESGCTVRGLGRDLELPPTTLRNRIKQAVTSEANSDWSAMLETIAPHDLSGQNELSPIEAARESKAEFERNRAKGLANAQKDQPNKLQPASNAQPTIISRGTSTLPKEPPAVSCESDGEEASTEVPSKPDLFGQAILERQKNYERLLNAMNVGPRPIRNIESLGRQGAPIPPKDKEKP